MATREEILQVGDRDVTITNPDKVFFPETGHTKLDLVRYYLAVAEGALVGVRDRPMAMKRFVDGAAGAFFFQKRAPESRPPWIDTVELSFPSGRTASEVVVRDAAALAWVINLGCIDLNPHPVRADDLDHPDELRVDLDPVPGVEWPQIRQVALVTQEALDAVGLVGWPKTSGSRGIHINVRIERRWTYPEVRRAALALARDVERRAPTLATSRWWKEERHGVFLDYNQNAKDRTVASAYSIRPTPDARVSMPLRWEDVADVPPGGLHAGDGAGARRGARRRRAPGSTTRSARSRPCSSSRRVTRPRAWATRPGRRTTASRRASRRESCRHASAGRRPTTTRPRPRRSARRHGRRWSAASPGRPRSARRSRARSPRRRAAVARRSRSSRSPVPRSKDDALAGLERWRARWPVAAAALEPADVLVDSMRGRSTTWTRIRVNLTHVAEAERPPQEALDPDYDPTTEWLGPDR